jgi:hypothetical protein
MVKSTFQTFILNLKAIALVFFVGIVKLYFFAILINLHEAFLQVYFTFWYF